MKFISLGFQNFMSFHKHQTLPLADLGLVLVNGDNQVSAAADSNGVGKTALFDAMSWTLFGQTLPRPDRPHGLKADEVAYRFNKDLCWTALVFEINGKTYSVERTRRAAGLGLFRLDGGDRVAVESEEMKDTQGMIDSLLGFGWRTFLNAVVFSQQAFERFATASQGDQMKMIDEIHTLDLTAALARAKEWKDRARGMLAHLDGQVSQGVTRLQQIAQQIEVLQSSYSNFVAQKEAAVKRLGQELQGSQTRISTAETELQELTKKTELVHQMKEEASTLEADGRKGDTLKTAVQTTTFELSTLEQSKKTIISRVQELLEGGKCPTCRLTLTGEKQKELQRGFNPDLQGADKSISAAKRRVEQARSEYAEIVSRIKISGEAFNQKYQTQISALPRLGAMYSVAVVQKQRQLCEQIKQHTLELETQLAKELEREWGGDAPLQVANKEKVKVEAQLDIDQEEKNKVTEAQAIAEYWIEAFGDRGIRSLAFDSVADFLNARLLEHLEVLTGGEASVKISALSALKKGGVKEKISINASWSWGAGNYAAGSAGQDRRIDLALFGAMQDLAERRSARPFSLRVWDEAGDSLDSRGKELFAEWVKKEARQRGSGFAVTHDKEFAETLDPDQVWTVVLRKQGGAEVVIQ